MSRMRAYLAAALWIGGLGVGWAIAGGGEGHAGHLHPVAGAVYAVGEPVPLPFGSVVVHRIQDVRKDAQKGIPGHHFAPHGRVLIATELTLENAQAKAVRYDLDRVLLAGTRPDGRTEVLTPASSSVRDTLVPAGARVTSTLEYLAPARSSLSLRVGQATVSATLRSGAGAPEAHLVRADQIHEGH
jgi:hypothetical protein